MRKQDLQKIIDDCKSDINLITEYKNSLNDLKQTVESKLATINLKEEQIDRLHSKLFIGTTEDNPIETDIDNLYSRLFVGDENETSIDLQFEKLLEINETKFNKLNSFYKDVFEDEKNAEGKVIKQSLIKTINEQKSKLDNFIKEANEKLYALTDSSLHNAFAKRQFV